MAASFLKRKPKEPERPQRVETPAVEADPELGLTGEQVHCLLYTSDAADEL